MTTATSKNDGINGALKLLLRCFRLRGFEENDAQIAEQATKAGLSYEAFLYEVAKVEAEERRNRRVERQLKESKLPREKTLATFDFTRVPTISKQLVAQLCEGSFADEGENLMGFGNPSGVLLAEAIVAFNPLTTDVSAGGWSAPQQPARERQALRITAANRWVLMVPAP